VNYSFADILLVDFPLTDRSGSKQRPTLVVLDIGDDDAPITSQGTSSDYDIEVTDWEGAGLKIPSFIRIGKLSTVDKAFVRHPLGKLLERDILEVRRVLAKLGAE
jgi:mRNA-degrading endonuclease toxin of MazEF toxin-antitoxin module